MHNNHTKSTKTVGDIPINPLTSTASWSLFLESLLKLTSFWPRHMWKGGSELQLMTPDPRDPRDLRDPRDPRDPRMNSLLLQLDVQMRSKSMAPSKTPRKVYDFCRNIYYAADVYQLFGVHDFLHVWTSYGSSRRESAAVLHRILVRIQ